MKAATLTLLILLLLTNMEVVAQDTHYTISKDKKSGSLVYNGLVTFDDLDKEGTFDWMHKGYKAYEPEPQAAAYLQYYLKSYSMIVFLGTWCGDSHDLIPRLEKLLRMINYPAASVTLYGVDRKKTTINGEQKNYDITKVPTFILLRDGREVGRITETVESSIEIDLSAIVQKDRSR